MLNKILIISLLLYPFLSGIAQEKAISFTEIESFAGLATDESIRWGKLKVPENWEGNNNNFLELAVAIVKSKHKNNEGLVFLQGGPGGSIVNSAIRWLKHPLRTHKDIILIDLRGTGLSEPQLCPDLGKEFMKLLAEDYTNDQEIENRVRLSMACKEDLLSRNIDLKAYNSTNISHDLHALKEQLNYDKWIVYGVSYGTRIAYDYITRFTEDVERIILDSPIPLDAYFDKNTEHFMTALDNVFVKCSDDPLCKKEYGDLQEKFYATLKSLSANPMTVSVPKDIHPSGFFVLNAQDFAIALQQGLYDKNFITISPLMIQEFHNRNEGMVAALVASLGARLSLDYGTYYAMLCNETLSQNSLEAYKANAGQYQGLIAEGLPFFKGDYFICKEWATDKPLISNDSLQKLLQNLELQTLVLSGEFDPITPAISGKVISDMINKSSYQFFSGYGHGPGFSKEGKAMLANFVDKNNLNPIPSDQQKFISNIKLNKGVFHLATSLLNQKITILLPIILATLIFIVLIFYLPFRLTKQRKTLTRKDQLILWTALACSMIGITFILGIILGISQTSGLNFYILAFGLPKSYSLVLLLPYALLVAVTVLIYSFFNNKAKNKHLFAWSIIPSLIILGLTLHLGFF